MRDKCTYCVSRTLSYHIASGSRWWNFPLKSVILSDPPASARLFTQTDKIRTSQKVRKTWHNSSTGYPVVVNAWSCVCVCQYVDILDQFPLTLVSVTFSLMFHHQGCEGWFLIWLPTAQFSYQAIQYAYPVFLCLALRPQAVRRTWRFNYEEVYKALTQMDCVWVVFC